MDAGWLYTANPSRKPTALILGLCRTYTLNTFQRIIRDYTGITEFDHWNFMLDTGGRVNFKTSVIFYKGSRARISIANPFHGEVSIDTVRIVGSLSRSMINIDPAEYKRLLSPDAAYEEEAYKALDAFWTDVLYIIFGGFGTSKFLGSIFSDAGKDMYYKIKDALKEFRKHFKYPVRKYINYAVCIVEIAIQIEGNIYLCLFNPNLDTLDDDFKTMYSFLQANKDELKHFDRKIIDLESL